MNCLFYEQYFIGVSVFMINTVILGIAFVAGTILLVLFGYFLMRRIAAPHVVSDSKELAGSVIFRISALHGLILALVFAQQMFDYHKLQDETVREASVITDIYFDIERHGGAEIVEIRTSLQKYVALVVNEEWQSLSQDGELSPAAWKEWEKVYDIILDLETNTLRQEDLRRFMLSDIRTVAEMRDRRAGHGLKTVSNMFWFAAISGIFLVSLAYYCFTPTLHHVVLISIFAAFTGIILFFIFSFSDPFGAPGALQASAFERLLSNNFAD